MIARGAHERASEQARGHLEEGVRGLKVLSLGQRRSQPPALPSAQAAVPALQCSLRSTSAYVQCMNPEPDMFGCAGGALACAGIQASTVSLPACNGQSNLTANTSKSGAANLNFNIGSCSRVAACPDQPCLSSTFSAN